ncbi:heavy metal-associated isoprenylated plant protein 16-like [Phragmites australis]|uniref:heavy metal-associated isoprenylated plant protein 16-like n=1 Tax=Phragmites australis TaxID=29695 RepID=UPI002D7A3695|nr:heavy metal-associated isoprenylated plant protein 16-like [Phragmites australis]
MPKQKIVIQVSMSSEKSRSKAMALVARADGVSSMGVTGDGKDRLEVVGDGVDTVCLVQCLRKKIGHAEILQVEEVKEKKPEEKKKPEEPKVEHQLPYWYPGYYYHHNNLPPPWR